MIDHPPYTAEEARARETFLALMWALSYPGREYTLTVEESDVFPAIADSLIDLETSYYTLNESLASILKRTGARSLSPDRAAYHFYPMLTDLTAIESASVGNAQYPDDAATLIIGCKFGQGLMLELSGPGIQTKANLQVDLPAPFWQLRSNARYPLGWDIFLVDGIRVVGIPRTTIVKIQGS